MYRADNNTARDYLLFLLRQMLLSLDGRVRTANALTRHPVDEAQCWLIAVGKAALAMTMGVLDVMPGKIAAGLVVTHRGHGENLANIPPYLQVIEAGHPLPDEASLHAGNELLKFCANVPQNARLLFLLSGGASSLLEVPMPGIELGTLRQINQWLLESGLDIIQVNQIRTRLSQIKGGGLLEYLRGRRVRALLMSDVPQDRIETIGSGLLKQAEPVPLPALPPEIAELLPAKNRVAGATTDTINFEIVASRNDGFEALAGITTRNERLHIHEERLAGEAQVCGRRLAGYLLKADPGVHAWGGETVVRLPARPGRGGRNQQLALAAATYLEGHDGIVLLACATDGQDGNTNDAGALVDGGTTARGRLAGFDAQECLARADAGSFLEASGDLVDTGPTGTNVADFVIAYKNE